MGVYDQIRARAAERENYVDPNRVRRTYSAPEAAPRVVLPSRTPTSGAAFARPGSGSGIELSKLQQAAARARTSKAEAEENDGWSIGDGFGMVGNGLMEVLKVVDAPRRLYQSVAGEMGDVVAGSRFGKNEHIKALANVVAGNPFQLRGLVDENGERDTGFDWGEIRRGVTGDNAMSQGFLGRSTWDDDLHGAIRAPLGFVGDLATDPLTYATFGVGGVAKKAGISAARETLAKQVADRLAREGAEGISKEVGDKLIREVGTRGLGGLTTKGLKRSGATADDLAKLGMDPNFGLRVGVGSKQKNLGGRRIAESVENLKGEIKKATGASNAGRLSREMFTSYKHGERKMRQAILSGSPDAATAARGLAVLGQAKGESWRWLDETANGVQGLKNANGKKLRRYSADEAKELTHALEAGNFNHPMVKELNDFFEKTAKDLQGRGVEFNTRRNYVPHRLSEKAKRALAAGDEDVERYLDPNMVDKPEKFQRIRQDERSIAEVNAEWRASGKDFDLLEDDARVLVSQYLVEGQEAVMKSKLTGDMAKSLGLVDDMGKAIDGKAFQADIDKMAKFEGEKLAESISNRRAALRKTRKIASDRVKKAGDEFDSLKKKSDAANRRAQSTKDKLSMLDRQLQVARQNADVTARSAKTARATEKAAWTRKVKEAEQKVADLEAAVVKAQKAADKATKDRLVARELVEQAETRVVDAEEELGAAIMQRQALEESPLARDPVAKQKAADKAAQAKAKAEEEFIAAESAEATASKTAQFISADVTQVKQRADQLTAEFDDWVNRVKRTKGNRKKATPEQKLQHDEMRELLSEGRKFLENATDEDMATIAKLNWQALQADAEAMMSGLQRARLQKEFAAGADLLDNPHFQKYIVDSYNDGFARLARKIGPDMQIDERYRMMIETQRKLNQNPGVFLRGFKRALNGYQKGMNWWKGWALASPGFVFRNMYSGMFNLYLDNIPQREAARFGRFLFHLEKDGPEAAQAWARKTYGPEIAGQMDEAYSVAAASGWGITSAEVAQKLTGEKLRANPLSANFPVWYGLRYGGSMGEAYLRGGHAFGVLRRGGDYTEALDRVQKFHFNYRDISDVDRGMKNVLPFWTFFSRNLALQASVFAKQPQKLTRSYYNMKRNIEATSEDPGLPIPNYMVGAMQAIRTPFGGEGGGSMYLTPDIPSIRTIGQADELGGTGIVNELMSASTPVAKVPFELLTNRNTFLDREYRNNLTTYDSSGEVPRYAPSVFQLPGIKQAVGALPGAEIIDGKLLMQDNVQDALMNVNPALGRTTMLAPHTERLAETQRQRALSFLGGPVRWNDPGSQAGAIAATRKANEDAARKVQERIKLEGLVRGD